MKTAGLPDFCYVMNGKETVLVRNGHMGFFPSSIQSPANELNEKIDVSRAQSAAMKTGCILGWNIPEANPANYKEDGRLK